jgi:hypothetical protein
MVAGTIAAEGITVVGIITVVAIIMADTVAVIMGVIITTADDSSERLNAGKTA